MSRDLLVTGGSGFIGQHLLARVEAEGRYRHVVNLDLLDGPGEHRRVDIRKPIAGNELADFDFEACVHLAGLAKEPGFEHAEYYATNLTGTENTLALCQQLGIKTVVFTSTMMVHAPSDQRLAETDLVNPNTAYGGSKALAEAEVLSYAATTGANVSVLRPGVVFGPGDGGNFNRLRKLLSRKMFFYVGRKSTVKSCVYIDDMVGFICHLLGSDGDHGTYNVAIPSPTTIEAIVTSIQREFEIGYKVPTVPYRAAHLASRPFELLALAGVDLGIHHRRIEKLYESTNIDAARLTETSYAIQYPTIEAAVAAWASQEHL